MSQKSPPPLVWQPKSALYISLFFLLMSAMLMGMLVFGSDSDKTASNGVLASIYLFPSLWGTIYGLRTRVEATENGLRWRDWRGVWRAAKWEEIRDFYTLTAKGATHRVETMAGKFDFDFQGDGRALAEWIPTRATNAPVRDWSIKGERPCDEWPRRFEFWRSDLGGATRGAFFVLSCAVVLMIYVLGFRTPPRGEISAGAHFLAYVAPPLLIPIAPFLFWLFFLVQARQKRPFRGQSVEISPNGLVFNSAARVEVSWAQIEAWNWVQRGKNRVLQLETASGTIEIPTSIAGFRALCRILERFSGVSVIREGEELEMAGAPIQNAPDDAIIFDFNNLGLQSLNWLFPAMGIAMLFAPSLIHLADPLTPWHDEGSTFAVGALLIALSLGWMWFLRVARLRLTSDHLEWHAPFFHRTLPWRDIESFGTTATNLDWLGVAGKKIKLSLLNVPVAQRSRLQAEIEKRALNARGKWE